MFRWRTSGSLVLLALALSCSDASDPLVCPADEAPGVVVEVRNAVTDEFEVEGSTGTLTDGSYVETLQEFGSVIAPDGMPVPTSLAGAYERAGVYRVVVDKEGFETWVEEDVVVRSGGCGVITRELVAELQPVD